MKRFVYLLITASLLCSCANVTHFKKTKPAEEQVFDSSLVHPLSDSVASLYRKE